MDLWTVSLIVIGIIVFIGLLLLGDYMGYKFGRARLAMWGGFTVLGVVVLFAIYAIVVSLVNKG
jgi:hypothetical protein